ncbi:unnamed protein product [Arctogadus glacialis]
MTARTFRNFPCWPTRLPLEQKDHRGYEDKPARPLQRAAVRGGHPWCTVRCVSSFVAAYLPTRTEDLAETGATVATVAASLTPRPPPLPEKLYTPVSGALPRMPCCRQNPKWMRRHEFGLAVITLIRFTERAQERFPCISNVGGILAKDSLPNGGLERAPGTPFSTLMPPGRVTLPEFNNLLKDVFDELLCAVLVS